MVSPRFKLSLAEAAPLLGRSYSRLFRRVKEGTIDLKVEKDELGRMFIHVDSLVDYLYPSAPSDSNPEPLSGKNKNKKGKPKTTGAV
jgi:hypothetical protein